MGSAIPDSAGASWLALDPAAPAGATPLDRVFGLRPDLYADFRRFYALFWERSLLDPVLLELCRLRIAQLHGCAPELRVRYRPALEAGLGEEKIAKLPRAGSAPEFSAAERAAIAFAELFASDPHAITDADAAAVVAELGDAGLVALAEALALFDGFCRFRMMLGVEPPPDSPLVVAAPTAGGPLY
jgi:alkylhydroperoxidase family enzyme